MWPALALDHPEVRQWDDLLGDGTGQSTGYYAFKSLTLSMKSAWLDWAYAGVGGEVVAASEEDVVVALDQPAEGLKPGDRVAARANRTGHQILSPLIKK